MRENAVTWLCSVADFDQNGMLSPDGQENLAEILSLCAGFPADFEQVDFEISGADLPFQWLNLSSLPAAYGLEDQGKALWQTWSGTVFYSESQLWNIIYQHEASRDMGVSSLSVDEWKRG